MNNGQKGVLVAATADENLVRQLASLNAPWLAGTEIVPGRKELMKKIVPNGMLPHEGEAAAIRIVLIDDDLEDGTGRDFVRDVRQIRGALKIIFVAREPDESLEVRMRQEGVHFFLVKPVDEGLLGRILDKAIEHESTTRRVGAARARPFYLGGKP
ncbi:MAG: response regulator [Planctomycetota bacterium]|jgi:CheY-like chemotaxis protein